MIKSETGSGVIVVCGHDRSQDGMFSYWAVPEATAEEIAGLLAHAIGGVGRGALDGIVMAVRDTAANARIDHRTVFWFRQDGTTVTGRYGGGEIAEGYLAGTLESDTLSFRYLQVEVGGGVDTGSTAHLSRLQDGRLQLLERFTWETREGGGTNRLEELAI
jgi:hypothetical protein